MNVAADADGNWAFAFEGAPKFADGEAVEYAVSEAAVKGYESEVSFDEERGFVVRYVHEVAEETTTTTEAVTTTTTEADTTTTTLLPCL